MSEQERKLYISYWPYSGGCLNTNFGSEDSWGYDCEYYNNHSECSFTNDDDDFILDHMCCYCGGGELEINYQGLPCTDLDWAG